MEQAGIAELFNTDFATARELVRQLGVNTQAGRQAPFETWQQGSRACEPDTQFPGQKAAQRTAEAMDKLPWQLPADAIEALGTLVADVARATTEAEVGRDQADLAG
eukprot:7089890-Lingulodinium_polyedra.AAC.1